MANTYNFLKNVYLDLKNQTSQTPLFIATLLLLVTIPLSFAVNNICLILLMLIAIIRFKKSNLFINRTQLYLIALYFLMVLSYFWSIDKPATLKALPKEIALFLIPLAFLISKPFTNIQLEKIKKYYSYAMVLLTFYFLIRAFIRYFLNYDTRVFFYHGEDNIDFGLVPKLLNAIHVSVFVALALFYFISKEVKSKFDYILSSILLVFILLLSSKNIILVIILLGLYYFFYHSKSSHKLRLRNLVVFILIVGFFASFGKIKNRFLVEFQSNNTKSLSTNVVDNVPNGVHYVSIKEAWTLPTFSPNHYFPGTAFRVYQFRIFTEIIADSSVLFSGLGLNASYKIIEQKAKYYNLFLGNETHEGYQDKNFHNQYIQIFSELGLVGIILFFVILVHNLKNAIKTKDFMHFAFAIIMISLFLTESFLWRQRGVVFFTLFYCLFNSNELLNKSKTKLKL